MAANFRASPCTRISEILETLTALGQARESAGRYSLCAFKDSVALALFVAFGYHVVRSSSDREDVEQLVDETHFALHVRLARDAMASADHPHHLKALDRRGCSFYCLNIPSCTRSSPSTHNRRNRS